MVARISAHGLVGQRHRVGTHVGDEADGAFAEIHAFIELLRQAHGALRGEAELARGFLLQRRGGERRRRIALALLAVDGADGAACPARPSPEQRCFDFARRGLRW